MGLKSSMKTNAQKISCLLFLACISSLSAYVSACDENCKREQATAKTGTAFPSYLTWEYCDGLKHDFMTTDVNNLQAYSSKHFNTKYKGPIKNIIKLIDQRKDWLQECDKYVTATRGERIFYDNATTKSIFDKLDSAKKELVDVLNGVRYSSFEGDETKKIVGERFETLFVAIDDHKNLMHLKGKYVYK